MLSEMNLSSYDWHVQQLVLLESRLSLPLGRSLMEPFDWRSDVGDVFADLQLLARNIATFVGSTDMTFAVAIAKQRRDIAGHIEMLRNRGEVFVEVDTDLLRHPASVPAVICHEVMHKVLYEAGIWLDDASENEKLTDIACVYAGLGKVMLNGCVSSDRDSEGRERGFSVGYVSRDGLAFGHAVVCKMRNIASEQADLYLTTEAVEAVRYWRAQLTPLSEVLGGETQLQSNLEEIIDNTQSTLCEKERDLRLAFALLRDELHRDAQLHRKMKSAQHAVANLCRGNGTPADFLKGVSALYLKDVVHSTNAVKARPIIASLRRGLSQEVFPKSGQDQSEIVDCPVDGTKLRVPSSKAKIKVLCPKCGYRFLVSTLHQTTPTNWFFR